jgi:hypothetical protein
MLARLGLWSMRRNTSSEPNNFTTLTLQGGQMQVQFVISHRPDIFLLPAQLTIGSGNNSGQTRRAAMQAGNTASQGAGHHSAV